MICLRAQRSKLYHMGIRGGIARTTVPLVQLLAESEGHHAGAS